MKTYVYLRRFSSLVTSLMLFSAGMLQAVEAARKTAAPASGSATPSMVSGYDVTITPANIAPTTAQRTAPVEVFGQPRMTKGHPCTVWDQEDINHYKEMLKNSKELQLKLTVLKKRMDDRMADPKAFDILPPPQKGPDGKWLHPGASLPPHPKYPEYGQWSYFSDAGADVSDLGILYVLTSEEKYGEYAKKILLSYANCLNWPADKINVRNSAGVMGAMLQESLIMMGFITGYDMIYNLPSWTPEERKQMHDEFFQPILATYLYPQLPEKDPQAAHTTQINNRGAIASCAVLMGGYATDDQELVNAALYGIQAEPADVNIIRPGWKQFPTPKYWVAGTAEKPYCGLLSAFFAPAALPGGMWCEGSPAYTFYALGSYINSAETLWHHGMDLYRHNNAIFKNMFDYPILFAYPDLTTPIFSDSSRGSLIGSMNSGFYEYGYRRYRDPLYLTMINSPQQLEYLDMLNKTPQPDLRNWDVANLGRHLNFNHIGGGPPSLLFDLDPKEKMVIPPMPSINYNEFGIGVLRTPAANRTGQQNSLLISYGPPASHGHPDKMHIDLYALDDILMPGPGTDFPYNNNPRLENWYHTTISHNTLCVDETRQEVFGYTAKPSNRADQLIYAPSSTMGLQRVWTNSVYPQKGVIMDRAVFMTTHYLADLFGAFSTSPHKYDLTWHICGKPSSNLKFEPMTFPEPVAKGYNTLTNVRNVTTDKAWNISLTRNNRTARLFSAAGNQTQVILAEGGFFAGANEKNKDARTKDGRFPTAPTIIERRGDKSTLYGNVLDYSDNKDGYVKSVTREGGLDIGYGLLRVTTVNGTDLCFAAYRPGNYKPAGLETDGLQVSVQMNGKEVAALYLTGGKSLKAGDAYITRSQPGLAYVEKTPDGNYIVGNPSPTEATVTVALPALAGLKAVALDDKGKRGDPATLDRGSSASSFSMQLKAGSRVEFSK